MTIPIGAEVEELRGHMSTVLKAAELEPSVKRIWQAVTSCIYWPPGKRQVFFAQRRAHYLTLAEAAERLAALIETDEPWLDASFDWDGFDSALASIAETARSNANPAHWKKAGRGRPSDESRAELIRVIASLYPEGEPKVHFHATVEMVLGYIGRSRENVHDVITAALQSGRRAPRPRSARRGPPRR